MRVATARAIALLPLSYRNRHECKFVVSESVAQLVLRRVQPFVRPDPHAADRPRHAYPVASLYLDDRGHSLYRESREGLAYRYKLRVRSYSDDDAQPVFLEVKRRHDLVVQKLRCAVPRDLLADALAGRAVDPVGASETARTSLAEFQRLVQLRRAMPTVIVNYERQAYVGLDDGELRVTVDRRLCALPMVEPDVRVSTAGFVSVPGRSVVLEFKFTDRFPPWMAEAIRACQLRRQSFSKYCAAFDALAERGAPLR
jgi:hypothetical protein